MKVRESIESYLNQSNYPIEESISNFHQIADSQNEFQISSKNFGLSSSIRECPTTPTNIFFILSTKIEDDFDLKLEPHNPKYYEIDCLSTHTNKLEQYSITIPDGFKVSVYKIEVFHKNILEDIKQRKEEREQKRKEEKKEGKVEEKKEIEENLDKFYEAKCPFNIRMVIKKKEFFSKTLIIKSHEYEKTLGKELAYSLGFNNYFYHLMLYPDYSLNESRNKLNVDYIDEFKIFVNTIDSTDMKFAADSMVEFKEYLLEEKKLDFSLFNELYFHFSRNCSLQTTELLKTFSLNKKIVITRDFEEKYNENIETTISSNIMNGNFPDFLLFYYNCLQNKWEMFFEKCQNIESQVKRTFLKTLIEYQQIFDNLILNRFWKFFKVFGGDEKDFFQLLGFPALSFKNFLTMVNSDEFLNFINTYNFKKFKKKREEEFKEFQEKKRKATIKNSENNEKEISAKIEISVNDLSLSDNDDPLEILRLFYKTKNNQQLKELYEFQFNSKVLIKKYEDNLIVLNHLFKTVKDMLQKDEEEFSLFRKSIENIIVDYVDNNNEFEQEEQQVIINFFIENPVSFTNVMEHFKDDKKSIVLDIIFSMVKDYETLKLMTKMSSDDKEVTATIKQTFLTLIRKSINLPKPKEAQKCFLDLFDYFEKNKSPIKCIDFEPLNNQVSLEHLMKVYSVILCLDFKPNNRELIHYLMEFIIKNNGEKKIREMITCYHKMPLETKSTFFKTMEDNEMSITTEEEFLNKNEKSLWLHELINKREIKISSDGEHLNCTYVNETKKTLQKASQKLEDGQFTLKEGIMFRECIERQEITDKIDLLNIFLEKDVTQTNSTELTQELTKNVTELFIKQSVLSELIRAVNYFKYQKYIIDEEESINKIFIESLHTLNEKLQTETFSQILQNKKAYDELEKNFEDIKIYLKYLDSEFYNIIYQYYIVEEKKTSSTARYEAKKDIDSLKEMIETNDITLLKTKIINILATKNLELNNIETNLAQVKNIFNLPEGKIDKKVLNNFYILINPTKLKFYLNAMINLIKVSNATPGNIYENLNKLYENVSNNNYIQDLEEINIDNEEHKKIRTNADDFLITLKVCNINDIDKSLHSQVMIAIGKHDDFFNFFVKSLSSVTEEKINQKKDYSLLTRTELNKVNLVPSDFKALIKTKNFVSDNIIKKTETNEDNFIKNFFEKIDWDKTNIFENIMNVTRVFKQLVNLFTQQNEEFENKEHSNNIMRTIMSNGKTTIVKNQEGIFECDITYERSGQIKSKNLTELVKYRELYQMTDSNIIIEDHKDINPERNSDKLLIENFCDQLNQINCLVESLNELQSVGYNSDYTYRYKFENKNVFNCFVSKKDKNNKETKPKIHNEIDNIKKSKNEFQNSLNKQSTIPLLTMFTGKHFMNLFSIAINDEKREKLLDNHYNNLIINGCDIENIPYQQAPKDNTFESIIKTNNKYIESILTSTITKEQIYQTNQISEEISNVYNIQGGIYTYKTTESKLEEDILNTYLQLTKHSPIYHTIFQCSEKTTLQELQTFLLAIKVIEVKALFTIFRIELLNNNLKHVISNFINEFEKNPNNKVNIKVVFVLFHYNDSNHIIPTGNKQIKSLFEILKEGQTKSSFNNKNKIASLFHNIKCFSSDNSGVGKSFQIRQQSLNQNYKYIFFPIGGVFTKQSLVNRLLNITIPETQQLFPPNVHTLNKLEKSKILLHIDLSYTQNINLMKEILFEILVLGVIKSNSSLCYLGHNFNIYIEIPNLTQSYTSIYTLLNVFNQEIITTNNLPELFADNINSRIQFVCNFLKFFREKKIDTYPEPTNRNQQQDISNSPTFIKLIKPSTLKEIIKIYIPTEQNNFTYHQIISIMKILYVQFKNFNASKFLSVPYLMQRKSTKARSFVIKHFLSLTKYFTKEMNNDLITQQIQTEQIINSGNSQLSTTINNGISFDNIDSCILFVNENEGSLSIISNEPEDSKQYNNLDFVSNLENDHENKKDLLDYKHLNTFEFLQEIKKVFNLKNPVTDEEYNEGENQNKYSLQKIIDNYVFTADNYVKIILIYLRIKARIPVILVGETGSGKTKMVKLIADLMLEQGDNLSTATIKIFKINAKIVDQDIIDFIEDNGYTDPTKNSKKEQQFVFFDEINTGNSMGLLAEIMVKHSVYGKKINSNVIFFAACNPYRLLTPAEKNGMQCEFVQNKITRSQLAYPVNPLPHSLLSFVLNFGTISPEEEKKYIFKKINLYLRREMKKNKDSSLNRETKIEIINKAFSIILKAHSMNREINGICVSSIRNIKKFMILFKWFCNDLFTKKKDASSPRDKIRYSKLSNADIIKQSIILAVHICYTISLPTKLDKKKLLLELNDEFREDVNENVIEREEYRLIENFNIPKGVSVNKIFVETIFVLFICINCRFPVFISGQSGSNKSTAVNMFCNQMTGEISNSPFFQKYPTIISTTFHCTEKTTSEEVLSVFNRVRNNLTKTEKIIPVVIFKEMNLAELSPDNPLKLLYSEIERNKLKKNEQICFIGISKHKLNPSLLNKGIFLSIPELEKEDLTQWAIAIGDSYNYLGISNDILFKGLTTTYYDYKELVAKEHSKYSNFHGLRDFYHFVKHVAKQVSQNELNKNEYIGTSIVQALERNFSGLPFSFTTIRKLCQETLPNYIVPNCLKNNKTTIDIIKANLKDIDRRIMLISSSSPSFNYILLNNLKQTPTNKIKLITKFLVQLGKDQDISIKNALINYMKQDLILVLSQIKKYFPLLDDLFKQNFVIINNKLYYPMPSLNGDNILCEIHPNFRCIILTDEESINEYKASFLHQFEKYILSYQTILNENKYKKVSEIPSNFYKDIDFLYELQPDYKKIIDLCSTKFNFDLNTIEALTYISLNSHQVSTEEIKPFVINKIVYLFTQDVIALSEKSILYLQNDKIVQQIEIAYISQRLDLMNLNQSLNKAKELNKRKIIIFTFTSIEEFEEKQKSHLKKNTSRKFWKFDQNEKALLNSKFINEFNNFYNESEQTEFYIHFMPNECKILLSLQQLILQKESLIDQSILEMKTIIFLIHSKRHLTEVKHRLDNENTGKQEKEIINNSELISILDEEYFQITIDDLFFNNPKYSFEELKKLTPKFLNEKFNINRLINSHIQKCYNYLKIHYLNSTDQNGDNSAIVQKTDEIKQFFNEYIVNEMVKNSTNYWNEFLSNISEHLKEHSLCFIDLYLEFLRSKFESILLLLIYLCELHHFILPYYNMPGKNKFKPLLFNCFKTNLQTYYLIDPLTNESYIVTKQKQFNKICSISNLEIPLIFEFFKTIFKEVSTFSYDYRIKDKEDIQERNQLNSSLSITINKSRQQTNEKQTYFDNFVMYIKKQYIITTLGENNFFLENSHFQNVKKDFLNYLISKHINFKEAADLKQLFKEQNIEPLKQSSLELVKLLSHFFTIVTSNPNFNNVEKLAFMTLISDAYVDALKLLAALIYLFTRHFKNLSKLIESQIKETESKQLEHKAEVLTIRNQHLKLDIVYPFKCILSNLILVVIYNSPKALNSSTNDNTYSFQGTLKKSNEIFKRMCLSLNIEIKELDLFDSFLLCVNILSSGGKMNKYNISKIVEYLKEEKAASGEYGKPDYAALQICLTNQLHLLTSCCGNAKNFTQNIMEFLIKKFNHYPNDSYRTTILNFIFTSNDYILNIYPLLINFLNAEPQIDVKKKQIQEKDFMPFLGTTDFRFTALQQFNDSQNEIAIDVILYYFEMSIYKVLLGDQENKIQFFLTILLDYLKIALKKIEKFYLRQLDDHLTVIAFLYSVAYVKIYLYLFSKKIIYKQIGTNEIQKLSSILWPKMNVNTIQTIRLYFMKCLYHNYKSLTEFLGVSWEKYQLEWVKKSFSQNQQMVTFTVLLFNLEHEAFNQELTMIMKENIQEHNRKEKSKELLYNSINTFNAGTMRNQFDYLLSFYDVSVNIYFSKFYKSNLINDNSYDELCNICQDLFSEIKFAEIRIILNLIYNKDTFKNKIWPIIKDKDYAHYEMFFYFFKLALFAVTLPETNYFFKLFSPAAYIMIKQLFNPGTQPVYNTKIAGYHFIKRTFDTYGEAENRFYNGWEYSPGLYKCDCGNAYAIEDCSFPTVIDYCSECKEQIGGLDHALVRRPGHQRVIQSANELEYIKNAPSWRSSFIKVPNYYIMFEKYEKQILSEFKMDEPGIPRISFSHFQNDELTCRKMDPLAFRILNMLFYSSIYFSHLAGFISEEQLNEFVCENSTCLEMLEIDMRIITLLLKKKSINDVYVFLNLLIPKLPRLTGLFLKEASQRKTFENMIESTIDIALTEYENKSKEYLQINQNIQAVNNNPLICFLLDKKSPKNSDTKNKIKYPYLEYFQYTTYPDTNILAEKAESEEKIYPVLTNYFKNGNELHNINFVKEITPFVKGMINHYSYNISRREAHELKLQGELNKFRKSNNNLVQKYETFKPHYTKFNKDTLKYLCQYEMKPITIHEGLEIAYFLNDVGTFNYGMRIAAIYEKFISSQNSFIFNISHNLSDKSSISYLKETLSKKVSIFDATQNEILYSNLKETKSQYKDIFDFLIAYSRRDCYSIQKPSEMKSKKNVVVYNQYNNYIIDYNKIEETLGVILLSGKKQFTTGQKFIVYKYEAFAGDNSSIISQYISKYPQKQLGSSERKELQRCQTKNVDDRRMIYYTLQNILAFLVRRNYVSSTPIKDVLLKLPNYIKPSEQMKSFFENHETIKLSSFMDVYEYFEFECFDDSIDNVNEIFRERLEQEERELIMEKLKNYKNKIFTLEDIEIAVKKIISRFLGGSREEPVNTGENLFNNLGREEFWSKHIVETKDMDLTEEVPKLSDNFGNLIKLRNTVDFYHILSEFNKNKNTEK